MVKRPLPAHLVSAKRDEAPALQAKVKKRLATAVNHGREVGQVVHWHTYCSEWQASSVDSSSSSGHDRPSHK
jgi:hypothetical protein